MSNEVKYTLEARGTKLLGNVYDSQSSCLALNQAGLRPAIVSSGSNATPVLIKKDAFPTFRNFMEYIIRNLRGAATKQEATGLYALAFPPTDVVVSGRAIGWVITVSTPKPVARNAMAQLLITTSNVNVNYTVDLYPDVHPDSVATGCSFFLLSGINNMGLSMPQAVDQITVDIPNANDGLVDAETAVTVETINLRDIA
jgi:hypothetical protein